MFGKDCKIKKYPYLAYSPNIIEYFAIIGYPEKIIPQILDCGTGPNGIKYSPTLLSFINSNTDFGLIDNELIIDDDLILYYSSNNYKEELIISDNQKDDYFFKLEMNYFTFYEIGGRPFNDLKFIKE